VPANQTRAATVATAALKNLACPNRIKEFFLHEQLLLNRNNGLVVAKSVSKRRCFDHLDMTLSHTLEGGVRIQGFQLIKCSLDFLQSGFRFLLMPFIRSAVQIGY
jgi:hypothetical protein